jgi:hypothetical protein
MWEDCVKRETRGGNVVVELNSPICKEHTRGAPNGALLKPSVSEHKLNAGVDAGVGVGDTGVGDVHVLAGEGYGLFGFDEEVDTDSALGSEVEIVGSGGDVLPGKKGAAADLKERNHLAAASEIPFQI